MGPFYTSLKENISIEKLYLDRNDLSGEEVYNWDSILLSSKTLKSLSVSSCKLSEEGLITIIDGLNFNKSITQLNLSDNNISDKEGMAIVQLLQNQRRPQLTYLNLANNLLTNAIGGELIEIVQNYGQECNLYCKYMGYIFSEYQR